MAIRSATYCLLLSTLVAGDIPVHCLRNDFAGVWKLHLGHALPKGQSSAEVPDFATDGITKDYCFSGHPNKNSRNVKLDLAEKMKNSDLARTVEVELSLDVSVNTDMSEHMIARSPDFVSDKEHMWTTTYDEGWEVRLHDGENPVRLFALAKYACVGDGECGQDGAGENADGTTKGYASQCGRTLVGWYTQNNAKGCFYGEKVSSDEANRVHSFVVEEQKEHHQSLLAVRTAYHQQDFDEFVLPEYSSVLEMHQNDHSKDFDQVRRAGGIKRFKTSTKLHVRDECEGDDISQESMIEAMEKKYPIMDWRTFANGTWNTNPIDQGACGSCYAIAMAYVLQARANIGVAKAFMKAGKAPPAAHKLSAHSILSCSYYNQGCDGGYPYLVAKHAAEFGVPSEECAPYGGASSGDVDACSAECHQAEDQLTFAKDYNYVGGFYGVCGQARVMKSLLEGPIVVAIEVPAPFNGAGGGKIVGDSYLTQESRQLRQTKVDANGAISNQEPRSPTEHHRQDPMTNAKLLEAKWFLGKGCASDVKLEDLSAMMADNLPSNSYVARKGQRFAIDSDNFPSDSSPFWETKALLAKGLNVDPSCVRLSMADGTMNGWEYTNHAITVVGWGQHEVRGETHKYWIIRNSWGEFYGDGGYAYVARGVNYAGIESQAVEITPDFSKGYLKKMLEEAPGPAATFAEDGSQ